jgi:predicted deacylase
VPFLGVDPRRSEVRRERVAVAQYADGSPVVVPVVAIRGAAEGPTAYLQAGIHGDEVTGIEVCRRLLASLDPTELRGTVVAVPIGNVPAYRNRSRSFLDEERGPIDMNRVFPGDPAGLLTERIAATLVEEFLRPADYAVDFHSALAGCTIAPCAYVSGAEGHPVRDVQERLAEAFGLGLICLQEGTTEFGHSNLTRSFCATAERAGVPAIIAEMGEAGRITAGVVELGVAGARRALAEMGNLAPDGAAPPLSARFRAIAFVHAERGGLVNHAVALGDRVEEGDMLGTVADPVGGEETPVVSPVGGIVLRLLTLGTCNVGAELAWVAHHLVGGGPR